MVKLLLDRGGQIDAKTRVSVSVLSISYHFGFLYSLSWHLKYQSQNISNVFSRKLLFWIRFKSHTIFKDFSLSNRVSVCSEVLGKQKASPSMRWFVMSLLIWGNEDEKLN